MRIVNLSGAAARTGSLKKKESGNIILTDKVVGKFPVLSSIKRRVPQITPSENDSR